MGLTEKSKKKVMVIFGTRPEAIKLAPVIKELNQRLDHFDPIVCVTGQHRNMLDQVLDCFQITPDYDLDIMRPGQDLFHVTAKSLERLNKALENARPDWVLVQGDTTTTFAGALAAFYRQIPVGHVEAGLRTFRKYSPFPEEMNRKLATQLSALHFTPTVGAKQNLLREGIKTDDVIVTGNTAIDALMDVSKREFDFSGNGLGFIDESKKLIVITAHRRESFGEPFLNLCKALKEIGRQFPECQLVYPVHLNPNVRKPVYEILANQENVFLIEPLEYNPFVHLMAKSYFILTDSGGIQEEAPSLNKPVLIMRETTERPECVEVGAAKLVGTETSRIVEAAASLLTDSYLYTEMGSKKNPFGDGFAARRIIDSLSGLRVDDYSAH